VEHGALTPEEARRVLAGVPTGLIGAAGEYFVAAELSRRGWLATVTIKNAPGTDVLAQNSYSGAVVAIQTKTASGGNQFMLNKKCEAPTSAQNEWFVFVKLNAKQVRPTYYVVPRNIVAGAVFAQHREWLSRPGPTGSAHKDSSIRMLRRHHLSDYEDRWEFLERPTEDVPLLIDQWYTDCVLKFGLPPGHPGWPDSA
jgi:hypothetical protein